MSAPMGHETSELEERRNEAPDNEAEEAAPLEQGRCPGAEDDGAGENHDNRHRPQAQAHTQRDAGKGV